MNLLVGATGFVGGHLVEYLFQQGEISKGVFRKGSHLKIMDTNGVQGLEADLMDHHTLHEAMEGVDAVYNLLSPMPDSDTGFLTPNTEGLRNLLEGSDIAIGSDFVFPLRQVFHACLFRVLSIFGVIQESGFCIKIPIPIPVAESTFVANC